MAVGNIFSKPGFVLFLPGVSIIFSESMLENCFSFISRPWVGCVPEAASITIFPSILDVDKMTASGPSLFTISSIAVAVSIALTVNFDISYNPF